MAMSMATMERTIRALQSRIDDLEGAHEVTLYRMERRLTRVEVTLTRVAEHLGVIPATDADVDTEMDQR